MVMCVLCLSAVCAQCDSASGAGSIGAIGGFSSPRGIAVDEATGDVYVVDEGAQRVARFDAEGAEVPFEASKPYTTGNALTGTPAGAFSFEGFFPVGVAVDGASTGVAAGDIYVTNDEGEGVWVYAADGTFLGEIGSSSASPVTGGLVCGVAIDGAGNVYVAHWTGQVDRYAPIDQVPEHDLFVSQIESGLYSCGVAVDSTGVEYVQHWPPFSTTGEVQRFPGGDKIDETGSSIAMNLSDDHAFVDDASEIAQYDAAGRPDPVGLPKFGSGILTTSLGVAVNSATGRVYASDSSGVVQIFATSTPGPPSVENQTALVVSGESAELEGEITAALAPTEYRLEYGIDTAYSTGSIPISGGIGIGEGEEPIPVRVAVESLLPGLTYHWRLVATNKYGTTSGEDHTFRTSTASGLVLPDNRAWELVSPADKHGGEIAGINQLAAGGVVQAAADGESITYTSPSAFGDAQGAPNGSQYVAKRDEGGWTTQNITSPTRQQEFPLAGSGTPYRAFSTDLSTGLQYLGALPRPVGLSPDYANFYLRNNIDGGFHAVLQSVPQKGGGEAIPASEFSLAFRAASPDLHHLAFETPAVLTSGATYYGTQKDPNLYEWSDGAFEPINVPPGASNGETTENSHLKTGSSGKGAISSDGSRVVWRMGFNLFVRDGIGTPNVRTVEVDASHGSAPNGNGKFDAASVDGERVFFTDPEKITEDSTAGGFVFTGEDLYEFSVAKGELVDLTVDHNLEDSLGAGVRGVLDTSDDGSYVYFVGIGALPQSHSNAQGQRPVAGQFNLYVSHNRVLRYITTLSASEVDERDWASVTYERTSRVSSDGLHAVFMSTASLTGYDNAGQSEVFLYDAASGALECVSCNPSGARAVGAASIPAGTGIATSEALYQSRVLSRDGSRVFFDSTDGLVPQDTNSREDVYEYESGTPRLISGGTNDSKSQFVDASIDGNNVFFITRQRLVGDDIDELADLYDSRVDGGVAAKIEAPVCSGGGCQGPPVAPPLFSVPATFTFSGGGNVRGAPAGLRKAKPKPTKKRASRRKHKISRSKKKKTIERVRSTGHGHAAQRGGEKVGPR